MTPTESARAVPTGASVRAVAGPIAAGCCLGAAALYTAFNDPNDGGPFLPCPFRSVTGWWCPGCGLTRATHHLLRGDLVAAFRYHLFVPLVLGAIAAAWTAWLLSASGRPTRFRIGPRAQVAAIAVFATYGIIRNLPSFSWLRG